MNIVKIFLIAILTFALVSCRKYVENVPVQGQRVLVYTQDYRLLINGQTSAEIGSGNSAILGCDDIDLKDPNIQDQISTDNSNLAMYTWDKPFYLEKVDDFDWNGMYKAMYTYNTVISGVLNSKGGSLAERNEIYAEALVQRAFTYFTLVNSYAKQYDAGTAGSDLGVPLLLEAKLFVPLPRATVAQVYAQVLKDLEIAIPLISVTKENAVRPSRAAAYALLAKVHLNMRNFEAARQAAEQSLALSGQLYDYNLSAGPLNAPFPTLLENKQILLRKIPRTTYSALQLSDDLLNLLGTKDLRYVLFTRFGDQFYPSFNGRGFWAGGGSDPACVGLTVNETWLIRAECLARAGQRNEAIKMLNDLRKFRFTPDDYVALTATSDQQALQMVIDERRREFFGTGLRWFDQKRLNKEPSLAKTVTRTFKNVTYTLAPNSNGYVFPFSSIIVNQNPELIQNPK
ncbi:RagB/SusD family nutrient uptake outer membrane protein [Mucilaginibacter sp. AW1-7]|uniref:RagB/SusD family nutrient uptake outer membrane protein n=1 Tax=Mucilaginibacter sp. AW1-7 TaxID=3349874 RepID=UPI003F735652